MQYEYVGAIECLLAGVGIHLADYFFLPLLHGRPDGLKKAYVRLTADYDALDVANKIGVI